MSVLVMNYNGKRRMPNKNLAAFDLEGTLLDGEIAEVMGSKCLGYVLLDGKPATVEEYMRVVTERGMRGELSFEQSIKLRYSILSRQMDLECMKESIDGIQLKRGTLEVLRELTESDYDIAVITGGPFELVEYTLERTGVVPFVTHLATSGTRISGGRLADVVPLMDKSAPLLGLKRDFLYKYIVAAGDGATDLAMKNVADKFIWVCPKRGLAKTGDAVADDLTGLPRMLREDLRHALPV